MPKVSHLDTEISQIHNLIFIQAWNHPGQCNVSFQYQWLSLTITVYRAEQRARVLRDDGKSIHPFQVE